MLVILLPLACVGLAARPRGAGFGLVGVVCLLSAYLVYAHPLHWGVYYLEATPALALFPAVGAVRALAFVERRLTGESHHTRSARLTLRTAAGFALAAMTVVSVIHSLRTGVERRAAQAYYRTFFEAVQDIRQPSIVFIRREPNHDVHRGLVQNLAPLARQPIWFVHDRGEANRTLLAAAPGRTAYLYDEARGRVVPLERPNSE
jgi:hypothetical protein